MAKAVIDLWCPVPKACAECPMLDTRWRNRHEIEECTCRLRKSFWINPYDIKTEKPKWCPMKEVE